MTTSSTAVARGPGAASIGGIERARVACVYRPNRGLGAALRDMSGIRFIRMAEALARRGHKVDLVLDRGRVLSSNLREVPYTSVRWADYDVIKTFFHSGFSFLISAGGVDHPFIVSKLGSVVGRAQTAGVHFYGAVRERLSEVEEAIARNSRFVTVLTDESARLWRREHGSKPRLLRVPTGVDAQIPPAGPNPYRRLGIDGPVAFFAGNIYTRAQQPEVNELWQERLNRIGRRLQRYGVRVVAAGNGDTDRLDAAAVLHVGSLEASAIWDWQRYARVGLVLAQGPVQDNESSKIYYYLRTELPVVCERPVPNAWLVQHTGHGAVVDYDDVEAFAGTVAELARRPPTANGVARYMVDCHSWDVRAATYDLVFDAARRAHG